MQEDTGKYTQKTLLNKTKITRYIILFTVICLLFIGCRVNTHSASNSLAYAKVGLPYTSTYYTGKAIKPIVKVSLNNIDLNCNRDYTVSYRNNLSLGKATVTIKGKGKYTGTVRRYFTITARPVSSCTVKLSNSVYVYSGGAKKPQVSVYNGTSKLTAGTSYTATYKNNTNAGVASVTIKGKRNFTGTFVKTFSILPRNVQSISGSSADTSITLSWSSRAEAGGYYIYQYDSAKKQFKKITSVSKATTNYTVRNLSCGTSYIFAVKAYKKSNNQTLLSQNYTKIKKTTTMPAVKNLKVTQTTYQSVYLSWSKVSGASGYAFYQYNSSTKKYTEIKRVKWNTDACTISGLKSGTTFDIAVRAYHTTSSTVIASKSYQHVKATTCKSYANQTLYVDGDSIAFGTGAGGYSYADALVKKYGFKLTKVPVPGSLLSSSYPNKGHIAESVLQNVNKTYNYAIIDGGVNDYYRSSPLGSISSSNSFDINTTSGALETIFYHFKKNYPKTKVYFLIPNKIYDNKANSGDISTVKNGIGLTYLDYYNALIKVCQKYNVTVIDCYKNCTFDTSDPTIRKQYMSADGVHPLKTTHINYYLPLAEKVMNLQ